MTAYKIMGIERAFQIKRQRNSMRYHAYLWRAHIKMRHPSVAAYHLNMALYWRRRAVQS